MQGTTKLIRFLLLSAITFALFEGSVTNLARTYAQDAEDFYTLSEQDMKDILKNGEKNVADIKAAKKDSSGKIVVPDGKFRKESISDLVELSTKDGQEIVVSKKTRVRLMEMKVRANGVPVAEVPLDSLPQSSLNIDINGGYFYYPYVYGQFNYADFKDALSKYLKDHGYTIKDDGSIWLGDIKIADSLDAYITDVLRIDIHGNRIDDDSSNPSDEGGGNRHRKPTDGSKETGGNKRKKPGSEDDDGLTAYERGQRGAGGTLAIGGGGAGGNLNIGGGLNIGGLAGLQSLLASLQGLNIDLSTLGSDPEIAAILAGIKDGSKTLDDLKAYLRSRYPNMDDDTLAKLASLLGSGLNLNIFAGGAGGNGDLASLLAMLGLGGAGGKLDISGGGNGDLAKLLALLGLGGAGGKLDISGGAGNGDLAALLASLGLGGAGGNLSIDLSGLLTGAGVDPSKIQSIIDLINSGASPDQIRLALQNAGITDAAKLNDLLDQIAKLRAAKTNPSTAGIDWSKFFGTPGAPGGPGVTTASLSGAYSFTEIPELNQLQVRNPDGSHSDYDIVTRDGKRVAVDSSGKVVFEFDGKNWKLVGSPSKNPNGPNSPDTNVNPEWKFLIEAGLSPSLVSAVLPNSGRIRGVWGDQNGHFFMTQYGTPVEIGPEMGTANQQEFEKLNLQK